MSFNPGTIFPYSTSGLGHGLGSVQIEAISHAGKEWLLAVSPVCLGTYTPWHAHDISTPPPISLGDSPIGWVNECIEFVGGWLLPYDCALGSTLDPHLWQLWQGCKPTTITIVVLVLHCRQPVLLDLSFFCRNMSWAAAAAVLYRSIFHSRIPYL